ncbi:MAG: transposase [Synergistaceae bacterium]|nr:transposase [Synergistaceae bacterium]
MKGGRCKNGIILPKGGASNVQGNSNTSVTDEITSKTIWQNIGTARWTWNWGLAFHEEIILRDVNMGIDVGVKSLAVVSCGGHKRVFRNINRSHKMRRFTKQLKHHQRILSRKKKGSKNYLKEKYRVQDLYGRIKRRRHEYTKQTAAKIVSMKPKVIVLEDLNIQGMMKNRHLARAVAEQNLYLLRTLIERKAASSGIEIKFADRFYPSSKTCSNCGYVKKDLKLSERIYKCPECGEIIDRDFNAALNLERLA